MRIFTNRITWGLLLIGAGVLFLLQNFNLLPASNILWAAIFVLGGVIFLGAFFSNRNSWWAAFPAFALFALAIIMLWDRLLLPKSSDEWSAAAFLGFLGLSFLAVYARIRPHWWPILPAGVLLTLSGVVGIQAAGRNSGAVESGGIFLLGLGLTFGVLYVLPAGAGRQRWAIWPALGLLVAGGLGYAAATELLQIFWPVALILVGFWILLRGFRR